MAKLLPFPATPAETEKPANSKSKSALTELRIEKLPVTAKTYYVQDAAQPGLSVRVSAGGVKAFIFTKHNDGKLVRVTLGRVGALRLDAARRAAQELHGDISRGIDLIARRKQAKIATAPSETMQQAFERFLTLKTRRPSTTVDYEFLWRLHIPAALKRKPIKDVTAADIEAAKRALSKHPRTANKVVILMSSIMAKSGRWADNPARSVSRHQEHVRTRRLTMDELQRVWSACEREPEWGNFFRLLILTGARRSPFCAMRWNDIDLSAGVWLVPATWAKSKREMAIPLSGEAVRILTDRQARFTPGSNSPWVFPSDDRVPRPSRTGHVVNPEKPFRRLLKRAGVHEHVTLHDIRRTLGSRLAMSGTAGATISKVLGHVSAQSLKPYLHLDVIAGSEAIDTLFADVVKPRAK
jgi:integrase